MSDGLSPALPLLLVDDEPSYLRSLSFTLRSVAGFNNLLTCADSRQAMGILAARPVSVILLDLTMPEISGEELLSRLIGECPEVPVIVLSGLNQVDTAVRCMKSGAFDYFVKTTETERLLGGIRRALAVREKRREYDDLKSHFFQDRLDQPEAFSGIVTRSRRMQAVFRYIEAVGASAEPVLIIGESGTGKELIARAVHRTSRPLDPWVAVNAAGLDDAVFSDTLFGHLRGAFTGADKPRPGMIEKAGKGVLFLDEIGDLAPASQVKLLRLLQEGEYFPLGSDAPRRSEARIVCATNVSLDARMAAGEFRRDLYYRLRTHQVYIPPLRERPEDLPLLLTHFLEEAARACGKKPVSPPDELLSLLAACSFPGNVRELRAMVFDAVSQQQGGRFPLESFRKAAGSPAGTPTVLPPGDLPFSFPARLPTLAQMGDFLVAEAMSRAGSNQTRAAQRYSPSARRRRYSMEKGRRAAKASR